MAELVDALVSGTSKRKFVQVRFLSWAPRVAISVVVAVRDYIIYNVCAGGGIGRHATLRG